MHNWSHRITDQICSNARMDAHAVIDLYKKDYLPKSHLSEKDVRDARDLCRDRSLLIRQRVTTINKIKHHAFCIGISVKRLGKRAMKILSKEPKLELLIRQLENTDKIIKMYNERIEEIMKNGNSSISHYARFINTIPGFGPYSSFIIAAEIDDVNRFPDESRLFSYVGIVPRIYQSGDKEWER